jgi:hypothetical protein
MFDDEAGPPVYGASRGLKLKLSGEQVKLMHQYPRPTVTVAVSEGSMQVLRHGNAVVGYGATQFFSEFSQGGEREKGGKLLFDAELPKGDGSYRVLRFPWQGAPTTAPALAAHRESIADVALYASWNGATDIASWQVLAGEDAGALSPVADATWSGFETKVDVSSTDSVFEVRALDRQGRVLASSAPVSAL